jgi:4-hydroxyphenylpyruvate dioxygenase
MEPTVEKDEFGEVVFGFIPTAKRCIFLWSKKLYGRFPTWLQGMETDYNPEPTGLKYIDHMVGNGLERNEYLG